MTTNILDSLLARVADESLRTDLSEEITRLRDAKDFGLVFERHLPESVRFDAQPIRPGVRVQGRAARDSTSWAVLKVEGDSATLIDRDGQVSSCPVSDLVVVRQFGEPVYPGLRRLARIDRDPSKAHHLVINAENFHGLETLRFSHGRGREGGRVDVVYIDPPYNTGARDWKYNNDYIDNNDRYRHSKWLSFMERRLVLAKDLMAEDAVLILTIDENELHHVGLLLERLFPDAIRQLVSICINPGGAAGEGLSRVEEYAFFCFLGDARPGQTDDDMLVADASAEVVHTSADGVRWEWLMRGGGAWYRSSRPNLCYPVLLDPTGSRIVRADPPYVGAEEDRPDTIDGHPVAWPVRKDGKLGIWRVDSSRLNWLADQGFAYVSRRDASRNTWTIKYLMSGTIDAIEAGAAEVLGRDDKTGKALLQAATTTRKVAKTMWFRGRHTAGGSGGTKLVADLLDKRGVFTFPKSIYSVMDALEIACGDNRDAVILDFFAGSGTTLHATALLNSKDDGRRSSIMVTNNEVSGDAALQLTRRGLSPGDPAWEKEGVFEAATMPRCQAAITGARADGTAVPGQYLNGRFIADGFPENVSFFALEYLEPDSVARGKSFQAIAPLLWMQAGCIGPMIEEERDTYALPEGCRYGVLFKVAHWRAFTKEVADRTDVTHAYVVTDSLAQYQQVARHFRHNVTVTMLYEDYLTKFEINGGSSL